MWSLDLVLVMRRAAAFRTRCNGLMAMAGDPIYDQYWQAYLNLVRKRLGSIDFADLIYLRSDLYTVEENKKDPHYVPPLQPLFGEKEGKIAKANRGRDPLYLFAALQRQLGYPEVPRPRPRDDLQAERQSFRRKPHRQRHRR